MYGLIQINKTHPIRKLMAYFWLPFSIASALVAIVLVGAFIGITGQPKAKILYNRSSLKNQKLEYNKVLPATNKELPLVSSRSSDKQLQSNTSEDAMPTSTSSSSSNDDNLRIVSSDGTNHLEVQDSVGRAPFPVGRKSGFSY